MAVTLNPGRNLSLDIAKGILILLMVIGHSGAPDWLVSMIYTFHMPCFFIISGLLFSKKYLSSIKTFYIKRVKSLWWPYVKWTWIFLLLHNIFHSIGFLERNYSIKEIFTNFFTTGFMIHSEQLLGGFWFISALFIASIFSVTYLKIFRYNKKSIIFGIISLVIIAELLCITDFKFYYLNKTNLLACAYFLTGALFTLIDYKELKYKKILGFIALGLLGFSVTMDKIEILTLNAKNLIPYFIQSVLISFAFLTLIELYQGKKWTKFFLYLGDKTLDILIIHFLAFKIVSYIKIAFLGMDYSHLSDFPVIKEQNELFWIAYVVMAIIVSLIFVTLKDCIRRQTNKFTKRISKKDLKLT